MTIEFLYLNDDFDDDKLVFAVEVPDGRDSLTGIELRERLNAPGIGSVAKLYRGALSLSQKLVEIKDLDDIEDGSLVLVLFVVEFPPLSTT